MEKKMENEMETGGIWEFKELKLSYYSGETLLKAKYTHCGNFFLSSVTATQFREDSLGTSSPNGTLSPASEATRFKGLRL